MPVAAKSPEDQISAIANTESTLHAILEEKHVRRDVQAKLAQLDEGTAEKLREWLHSVDVGLDRTGTDKIQTAKVVAAWQAATVRTSAQRQLESEQRTAGLPAAIQGGMFVSMRKAWEAKHRHRLHAQTLGAPR